MGSDLLEWSSFPTTLLLPSPTPRMLQFRLPPLRRLPLRLADDEGAATHVFGSVEFFVCHVDPSLA